MALLEKWNKKWPKKWPDQTPAAAARYPLKWKPEPYIGTVDYQDGVVCPHPEPENPKSRLFLAVDISTTQFQRHGKFIPTSDSRTRNVFETLPDPPVIYLVAELEDPEAIFVMAAPYKTPMLIGKLEVDTPIYDQTLEAFKQWALR